MVIRCCSETPKSFDGYIKVAKPLTTVSVVVGGILVALGPLLYYFAGVGTVSMASLVSGGGAIILASFLFKIKISMCLRKTKQVIEQPRLQDVSQTSHQSEEITTSPMRSPEQAQKILTKISAAITQKDLIAFKELVPDVFQTNTPISGQTLLQIAARLGATEITSYLLDNGADINARNSLGYTPIYYAVCNSHIEVIDLLLSKKADLTNLDGRTPLHEAAELKNNELSLEITKKLIDAGAEVNAKDSHNHTPLFYAAVGNNGSLVSFLLEKDAWEENIVSLIKNKKVGRDVLPLLETHEKTLAS